MRNTIKLLDKNFYIFLGIGVILFAIAMVSVSPKYFIYDEAHYYANTELLSISSNGLFFLRNMKGPVGPLMNFIQFFFGSIFEMNLKFLRLINLILIISTSIIPSFYFFGINKKNNIEKPIKIFIPIVVCFSLPFTWIISGMALTEAGSVFFTMLTLFLLSKYIQSKYSKSLYLFLSSLASSIASTGRQTLIVLSPIMLIFMIYSRNKKRLKDAITFFGISLFLPIILFFIWGGIIPQDYHVSIYEETGVISIKSLLLSVGYLGFSFLFVCPSKISKKIFSLNGIFILLLSIIPTLIFSIDDYPLKTVVNNLVTNPQINKSVSFLFPILSLSIGLNLFSIMVDRFRNFDIDEIEQISWIMIILIMLSNLVITHQFSARYLAVGLAPIIIIGTSLISEKNILDRLGNLLGILLGIISLSSYYDFF